MSCAFDKEMLTGYFDGELGQTERAEVEKHISACSECLRELSEIKSAAGLVRTLPRLKAPSSIAEAVRLEVASKGRVHSLEKYRRSIAWTFSAAAALLVVATVSFFTGRQEKTATEEAEGGPSSGVPMVARAAPRPSEPEGGEYRKKPAGDESADRPTDGFRRRGAEQPKDELKEAAAKEGNAPAPPGHAFGKAIAPDVKEKLKDGSQDSANRLLPQEQAAERAPKPPPAPVAGAAPAAPPPEGLNKKKLAEDKPTAPADPPASPKAGLAKAESKRDATSEPKYADKAGGRLEMLQQQKQSASGPSAFTVDTAQVAATRQKVRELLAKWNVREANAAVADGKGPGPETAPISVDLTPTQFAELKKQLEAQPGARLMAGSPEETLRNTGPGSGGKGLTGGLGAKPGEDSKAQPPAARGLAPAPAREAEAQSQAQGRADEERKDRQAAEKAKDSKEADSLAAAQARPVTEPRQKFILYFREVTAGK
jgi:hypothetical protein